MVLIALLLAAASPFEAIQEAFIADCSLTMFEGPCRCAARGLAGSTPGRFWMEITATRGLPPEARNTALEAIRERYGISNQDIAAFAESARAAFDTAIADCR
ncbi:hypothetical protein IP88_07665 [alpha proteobacterium AAP81b]|nr:hypothetical protein IP88_07665 [alpha proteobacterium AAP81b]